MQPRSNPRFVADQMVVADRLLNAFASGAMPMHADGYLQLAVWVNDSFRSMDSASLRGLRGVAPPELRDIVENVLQERSVIFWAHDDLAGFAAMTACVELLNRCRRGEYLA